MAGQLDVTINSTVTGLGSEDQLNNTFTHGTAPTETIKHKPIVGTSDTALDAGGLSISAAYALVIKAKADNIYLSLNAISVKVSVAHIKIPEGHSAYIPLNTGNVTSVVTSIHMIGSVATAQAEYILLAT